MSKPKKPSVTPRERRHYEPSFKKEAVAIAREIGFRQAGRDLDVGESVIRRWADFLDERGQNAFEPLSDRTDTAAKIKKLEKENRILKMEREILKKAAIFFAKEEK